MTKYIFSKNFFYRNSGIRLDNKIEEINSLIKKNYQMAHDYFKATESLYLLDKVPKTLLTNIKISETHNSIVGKVRKLKLTQKNPHFIPEATAYDIVDNVVLEKKYQKYLYRGQLHKEKSYYNNEQEVFWGTLEELRSKELLFFYVICRDMLNSEAYRELVEESLIDYIPYAKVLAYRDIELNEDLTIPFDKLFPEVEYETVATIQDEAIFRFYLLNIVDKIDISKIFFENLKKPVQYWSGKKSRDKIERVKKSKNDFSRFDDIFARFLDEHIKTIFEQFSTKPNSLGIRVYSIFRNDALELAKLFTKRIDGEFVSETIFENAENLVSISSHYATQLQIQQKNTENIDLTLPKDLTSYKFYQDALLKIDVEDSTNKYIPIEKLIDIYNSKS